MGIRFRSLALAAIAAIFTLLLGTIAYPQTAAPSTDGTPPLLINASQSVDVTRPNATAYSLWTGGTNLRHEVWFRVLGGDALYQQRLRVYKEQAPPRPINELPPESNQVLERLGNSPSPWYRLGFESEFFTYYFDGDYQYANIAPWDDSFGVRVIKTVYENGDLYDIRFEDQNQLDDYNDLEIEVVMIRGQRIPL